MGNLILTVTLCFLIPLLMLLGLLEKKARRIIFAVVTGCVACLISYFINIWIGNTLVLSDFYLTTTVAPIVEETLKFIPVVVFSFMLSEKIKNIIPISFAVGIGFAVVENSFMMAQSVESATVMWMIIRGVGTGLMHSMSTAIMGVGIYFARTDKRLTRAGVLASLFLAMMYHGAYNCLVQTEGISMLGILLPVITYAAVFIMINMNSIKSVFIDRE